MRKSLVFAAFILGGAVLSTWAEFDTNIIDAAFNSAIEKINKRKEEVRGFAARSIGKCLATSLKCPFANGQHFQSRPSTRQSREIADNARIFEEATKALAFRTSKHGIVIRDAPLSAAVAQRATYDEIIQFNAINLDNTALSQVTQRCRGRRRTQCNPRLPWRTGDGRCNNLRNPHWGRSNFCMTRLLPPAYENGIDEPRGGRYNSRLPNARVISRLVNMQRNVSSPGYTHMLMQVGQFIDHDTALAPMEEDPGEIINLGNPNNPIDCCSEDRRNGEECFSFEIPQNDAFFGATGRTCNNMPRSAPCSTCKLGHREQQDALTSYIDASQIYGSSDDDNNRLRAKVKGLLKYQVVNNRQMLPRSFHPDDDRCSIPSAGQFCFRAGDERVNEQPGLTALHLIWLRQHNLVAQKLNEVNPHWDDERLFQEARRIITAQWQHIVYHEWLPIVLGPQFLRSFNIQTQSQGYTNYDPTVDATIINEFAAAAFRFGHSLIDGTFHLINNQGRVGAIQLQDFFFFPFPFYEGQLDPVLRGLFRQPGQQFDRFVTDDVTNHLYRLRNDSYGLDLIAMNIQRGRDHGIRPYVDYVRYCTGREIRTWHDLLYLMPQDAVQQISQAYARVEDVDLFPAGVSEFSVEGGVLGPTFACIQANQFMRAKFGDRFYYEHGNQAGSFTPQQLQEIRKISLAKIICDNSDGIQELPPNVFRHESLNNPTTACTEIDRSNIRAWAEQ
ncbi:peroxidase-like isoform X2 [Varroa jacobsoni]|uniref:peroxidase-like isoform X2 n=1 Tax=Varroa jacobsoni TaxID=62625 RepID=UPI000BF3CE08|nr:peroxidase-like isoform X2 [Varroa jacobsoni]